MTRSLILLFTCLSLAVALAGCGNKEEGPRTEAGTEGPYIEVAGLTYQVQLSRLLNVNEQEDAEYLLSIPEAQRQLSGDQSWFGVWLRVENQQEETLQPAREFEIEDTQGKRFRPVSLDTAANPFAYDPQPLKPRGLIPAKNSAAEQGTIQGSLLLFRIPTLAFQNRPFEFKIEPPIVGEGKTGVIDLDV